MCLNAGIRPALLHGSIRKQKENDMCRKGIALVLLLVMSASAVQAGVVPGRWDKVIAEKPGTEMIITLLSGEEIRGAYQEVGAEALLVTVGGASRDLPKSGIAKITTADRRTGPLWNGPVIGAAIGGGIPLIAAAGVEHPDGIEIVALFGALIGAGIGLGIDAAYQTRITLYKAPGVE